MPRTMVLDGRRTQVATEQELLAFANAIREAGGANVLEALLPSERENSYACLIANALNFGCKVEPQPHSGLFADGSGKWIMHLPHTLSAEHRQALGRVKGVRLRQARGDYYLTLPKHIGNAADAFDRGVAFTEFAKPQDDR